MKTMDKESLHLADAETRACREVGEKHGWNYWVKNALVQVKLGETPLDHIMNIVEEVTELSKIGFPYEKELIA